MMRTPPRLILAAALLALCGAPAARPQATNIPTTVAARTLALSTNGVVKAPKTVIYWPTQTNYFHRATVTNLTVATIAGIDAVDIPTVHGTWSTNNVQSALLDLAADIAAVDASAYLPKIGGTMSGAINLGENSITNVSYLAFDARGGAADNSLYVNATEDLVYLRGAGSASPGTASLLVMSSDGLVSPHDLKQAGATDGQVLAWDDVTDGRWEPLSLGSIYLALAGGTLSGDLSIAKSEALLAVTSTNGDTAQLKLSTDTDATYPAQLGRLTFIDGQTSQIRADIIGSATTANRGLLEFRVADNTGSMVTGASLDYLGNLVILGSINAAAIDAADLNGSVPTASLGSGAADGTTYLRGDRTWATVAAGLGGTSGTRDNGILRADGVGGSTVQSSELSVADAATATANNVRLVNEHAGQTNSSLGLTPKGSGALFAGPAPDGTATGGNARGTYAVDLQILRTSGDQVASGQHAVVVGGYRNKATSLYDSVIGGDRCEATGGYGSIAGGYVSKAQSTTSLALGNSAIAAHANAAAFGFDSAGGPTTDRANQVKIRSGSLTLQTATGTLSVWGKQSAAPTTGVVAGDLYYDTGTNKWRAYDGAAWNDLW